MIYGILSGIILAFQFSATKMYQSRFGAGLRSSMMFTALTGLAASLLFFVVSGFKAQFSLYSVLVAFCMSVACVAYQMIGFKLMAMGGMAVYTLFLMLGTMVLPSLYGILMWNEATTILRWVAMAIIALALLMQCLDNSRGIQSGKRSILFPVFCLLVFLCNGAVGTITAIHTHAAAEGKNAVDSISFVVIANLVSSFISMIVLIFTKSDDGVSTKEAILNPICKGWWIILAFSAFSGLSYWLLLLANECENASALFPVYTGTSVILTALAAWFVFHEKPSKMFLISMAVAAVGTVMFAF